MWTWTYCQAPRRQGAPPTKETYSPEGARPLGLAWSLPTDQTEGQIRSLLSEHGLTAANLHLFWGGQTMHHVDAGTLRRELNKN